jgi:uncharacterized protein YydD (DUF2326 family)
MIYQIYSDLQSFKNIRFRSGLNILLADKSLGATNQQTRNRAGKTSLIETIHFLTGADVKKDSIFRTNKLIEYSFGMEFDLGDVKTIVERTGKKGSRIAVIDSDTKNWPITPNIERNTGKSVISNNKWKIVLADLIFELREKDEKVLPKKFGPTFRSLLPYFVRRELAGAFSSPMKQSAMQQIWDQQVAISFLLGIDWTISQQWQIIREREKTLKELKKAAGKGAFGEIIGTVADLRTELTVSQEKTRRLRENINSFKVLPEYRGLEMEASNLTQKLGDFSNDNIIDRELIAELEQSLAEEKPPSFADLERLYEEAGAKLSGMVIRYFEDISRFHESVIKNRKSYLSIEVDEAKQRISNREQSMHSLSERRSQIMAILKSHGALEQFNRLQSEQSRVEAETENLRQRFFAAEQLEGQKTEFEIERSKLLVRLRQDYQEQEIALQRAILAFEEISNSLYEEAGSLTINESSNGPKFDIRIQGERSKGIKNMQIFCFDMMLMRLCAERGIGPGFLVHDSHLFDGVDERQVAKALQIGAEIAEELNVQYIVTMNSDAIPKELPDDFNLDDYILPLRLTDATEEGGLFGLRF